MPFCECGGIINKVGKCVECGRAGGVVATESGKTESHQGPVVSQAIPKPDNVVIDASGRSRNTFATRLVWVQRKFAVEKSFKAPRVAPAGRLFNGHMSQITRIFIVDSTIRI